MEDHSTPPLFDLKARQLAWRLSAHWLHFNDGLNVLHFTRTTISPFQVVTWHVGEIPPAWLEQHGKYDCFRAGLTIIGASPEVKEELLPASSAQLQNSRSKRRKVAGPVNFPAWWVE